MRRAQSGYGYMWWVWDGANAIGPFKSACSAVGAVGQWITVFPALQLLRVLSCRRPREITEIGRHHAGQGAIGAQDTFGDDLECVGPAIGCA